jgi:uncharacterized protein
MPLLLYLHGFRSSPQSFKAQWLEKRLSMGIFGNSSDLRYACPALPASPADAFAAARALALQEDPATLTLVGSSLGGFYATALAEQLGCRAVLLNPAVFPQRDLAQHVGQTTAFHSDTPFHFKHEFLAEFSALTCGPISRPTRYFLIAAKGDMLLDWREMTARYPGARLRLLEGSDHGLSDFSDYGDEVIAFAKAAMPA